MAELKSILAYIAKSIVDDPDAVEVQEEIDEDGDIALILTVAPDDMAKVIGKHGKIARAIRLLMKSAASTADKRVSVEIR